MSLFGLVYQHLLKPIFFLFDPEYIHDRMTANGHLLGRFGFTRKLTSLFFRYDNTQYLEQTLAGIKLTNPVGLSAGFDKDANLIDILPSIGFGFMEVGSITHKPYEGNPKPRLIRLKKSKALVVYYGLKNLGVDVVSKRILKQKSTNFPLIISVAKTNCEETSETSAGADDYVDCLSHLEQVGVGAAYTINISCPNTFGGEPFTTPEKLDLLLGKIAKLKIIKPVFVKMPINLSWKEFDKLLKVLIKHKITGVIIGNLNKDYKDPAVKDALPQALKGGISGKPTEKLSNELISKTYKKYHGKLIIFGVGGIFSAEDAYEKIKRGANAVQLITGMIYQGPQLIGEINKGLVRSLKKDGFNNISEAVGSHYKVN